MKSDINNQEYILKMKKAMASEDGILIYEYLLNEFNKLDYEKINVNDRDFASIGQDFVVMTAIKNKIKHILSFLDNISNN